MSCGATKVYLGAREGLDKWLKESDKNFKIAAEGRMKANFKTCLPSGIRTHLKLGTRNCLSHQSLRVKAGSKQARVTIYGVFSAL